MDFADSDVKTSSLIAFQDKKASPRDGGLVGRNGHQFADEDVEYSPYDIGRGFCIEFMGFLVIALAFFFVFWVCDCIFWCFGFWLGCLVAFYLVETTDALRYSKDADDHREGHDSGKGMMGFSKHFCVFPLISTLKLFVLSHIFHFICIIPFLSNLYLEKFL